MRDVLMENKNYFREITAANMARLSNMSHSKSSGERYFDKFLLKTILQINGLKRVKMDCEGLKRMLIDQFCSKASDVLVGNMIWRDHNFEYDSFSDVGESRVWFASKNLTPCRMY